MEFDIQRVGAVLKQLESVAQRMPAIVGMDPSLHYGVTINVMELLDLDPHLGQFVLNRPTDGLELLDQSLPPLLVQPNEYIPKPYLHARLVGLPSCPEFIRPNISAIRSNDVGKLLTLHGTIIRTGGVRILEHSVEYECAKCHHVLRVLSDIEQGNVIQAPPSSSFLSLSTLTLP